VTAQPAAPPHAATGPDSDLVQRKHLGQHFLRDARIVRRILDAADIRPGEHVLEVGPGDGVLTRPLCAAVASAGAGRVTAVEADPRFAEILQRDAPASLRVVRGDALRAGLAGLGPFDRIVSNLPYQISGPITMTFLRLLDLQGWRRAVLMFQKEFADRLRAGPGSKTYGRLSVHAQRRCTVTKICDVAPGCFDPPPEVSSTVVALDPHATPPFSVRDEEMWDAVVDGSFQQRRKKLRNSVPSHFSRLGLGAAAAKRGVAASGFATRRPEDLSPAEFAALAEAITVATHADADEA
jgi:16S rRNA (adenine1518-N6/adenine1519-N6)-dimethyltransferase